MTPRQQTFSLIATVAKIHGVTMSEILDSADKRHAVVVARWAAIHAIRQARPHFSECEIARVMRMHPSSVHHALRKKAPAHGTGRSGSVQAEPQEERRAA